LSRERREDLEESASLFVDEREKKREKRKRGVPRKKIPLP